MASSRDRVDGVASHQAVLKRGLLLMELITICTLDSSGTEGKRSHNRVVSTIVTTFVNG